MDSGDAESAEDSFLRPGKVWAMTSRREIYGRVVRTPFGRTSV